VVGRGDSNFAGVPPLPSAPNPAAPRAPWWESYFSAQYGALYRGPLAPELSTEDDVETVARLFSGSAAPVLDVGCGYGRHLDRARRAGVPAVGLEYSAALLNLLPRRARKAAIRGDMRSLPFAGGALGGAWMLFNTFGYFDDAENEGVLAGLARVLAPGARLLMDAPARSAMVATVRDVPSVIRMQERVSIQENWTIDSTGKRLNSAGQWVLGGVVQTWAMSLRLYTPAELERLLRRAGFAGEIEIRPLEELTALGTGDPAPKTNDALWRRTTNMAVLAAR